MAGNMKLDFEEFYAMQPKQVREDYSPDEILQWFQAADVNSDGSLSINEFFCWSLSNAALQHGGMALQACFGHYDKNSTGYLDYHEFEAVATDMGFGAVAAELFQSFDTDGSGEVAYNEIANTLQGSVPTDPHLKKLLTTMVFSSHTGTAHDALDTSGWEIKGKTVDSVRCELRELLAKSGGHVVDLIKLFDTDADTNLLIDDMEFISGMKNRFGYKGPPHVLDELFSALDSDGSGQIGFDELFQFVRGQYAAFHVPRTTGCVTLRILHGIHPFAPAKMCTSLCEQPA